LFLIVLLTLILTIPAQAVDDLALEELGVELQELAPITPKEFMVYKDANSMQNHFAASGWMGDYGDLFMNEDSKNNPYSGASCIQVTYSAKRTQNKNWSGVYWQSPANNWGSKKGGFDLTGMTTLSFKARGANGGEVVQKFMLGGINGIYPDSTSAEIGPIELTDSWQEYTINLAGKELTYINGGFGLTITGDLNPDGAVFYLDDIKFIVNPDAKPQVKMQEAMPFYIYTDSTSVKNHFIPSGWMGDYSDIKYKSADRADPYLGDTCIKIIYTGEASQGARWSGVYWQNPAGNWGSIDAGYDLSGATKLTFWAKGEEGGERIEEFKIGGLMGEFSDSDVAMIGPVILNKDWTQYTIDLLGKDMSYIIGGLAWSTNIDVNPNGVIFYLDEIKFE